jgi:hypothetical protein
MKSLRVRRSALPSRWALIVLAACVAASMFINYRASAQSTANKPAQTTTAPADPATKPGEPAASKGRAPASKPEDSATIQDDATIVPDDKESADNNITFPTDI